MQLRYFQVVVAAVLFGTISLTAQKGSTQEKLYVSLENLERDNLAVVDTGTNNVIKTLTVGSHPHGMAAPASQDRLYVAAEVVTGLERYPHRG